MSHEMFHKAQPVLAIQVKVEEVVLDKTFQKLDKKGGHDLDFYWFANQFNGAVTWAVPIFEGHHYLAVDECMHFQIWNNSNFDGSINVIFW